MKVFGFQGILASPHASSDTNNTLGALHLRVSTHHLPAHPRHKQNDALRPPPCLRRAAHRATVSPRCRADPCRTLVIHLFHLRDARPSQGRPQGGLRPGDSRRADPSIQHQKALPLFPELIAPRHPRRLRCPSAASSNRHFEGRGVLARCCCGVLRRCGVLAGRRPRRQGQLSRIARGGARDRGASRRAGGLEHAREALQARPALFASAQVLRRRSLACLLLRARRILVLHQRQLGGHLPPPAVDARIGARSFAAKAGVCD